MKIFIQCEAGSKQKHFHDEKTLKWKHSVEVPAPYPYPYGFILGTTSEDGGNVDCFVITKQSLQVGQIVTCEPIGLMEQFEVEEIDHKVLARPIGEKTEIDAGVRETLTGFVYRMFEPFKDFPIRVGRFLGREQAEAHIAACWDTHQPEVRGDLGEI
jgi:inorganic pyrophosphatase